MIWSVLEIFLVPKMEVYMTAETVDILKETIIKIIVWFLPSLALIIKFNIFILINKIILWENFYGT